MTRMIFGGEKPKSKKFGLRFGRTNSGRGSRPYSGSKPHFADDDLRNGRIYLVRNQIVAPDKGKDRGGRLY